MFYIWQMGFVKNVLFILRHYCIYLHAQSIIDCFRKTFDNLKKWWIENHREIIITTASVCFYFTPTLYQKPSLQNYSEVFQTHNFKEILPLYHRIFRFLTFPKIVQWLVYLMTLQKIYDSNSIKKLYFRHQLKSGFLVIQNFCSKKA